MSEYQVSVAETLLTVVTVVAKDEEEAIKKVKKAYRDDVIKLGIDDMLDGDPSIEVERFVTVDGTEQRIE